jgi:hypothetical protein
MKMRRGFVAGRLRKPLVNIATLDRTAGKPFGDFDDARERLPIIRIAAQCVGVQAAGGGAVIPSRYAFLTDDALSLTC